jgi:hypothetical protein
MKGGLNLTKKNFWEEYPVLQYTAPEANNNYKLVLITLLTGPFPITVLIGLHRTVTNRWPTLSLTDVTEFPHLRNVCKFDIEIMLHTKLIGITVTKISTLNFNSLSKLVH